MAKQEDDLLLEEEIDGAFFEGDEEATATKPSTGGAILDDMDDAVDNEDIDVPGQLAVDIYETQEKLIIKSRVAGVNAKDLDINITDGMLTINGTLSAGEDAAATQWHVQECYWGEFNRTISLPLPVKEEEVEAILKDGVLTISFAKVQPKGTSISVIEK